MEFKNKDVLVIGMGISGVGAAALLCDAGARVMLFDSNEKLTMEEAEKKLTEGVKADIYIGTLPDEAAKKAALVVVSPGVPTDTPFIDSFRERNVPIWSEIELAYHSAKGKLIAITGTNGKTTTTALTGQIMKD